MRTTRIIALVLILLSSLAGFFVYATQTPESRFAFRLGLDLNGGTRLSYGIDVTGVSEQDIHGSLSTLKEVIERRVNLFGVSEPVVQIERSLRDDKNRLVVELPGVTDINEAIQLIGKTPFLEFRILSKNLPKNEEEIQALPLNEIFIPTGLTGRFLKNAQLVFGSSRAGLASEVSILVEFNEDGKKILADFTPKNIGNTLGIFLDGQLISSPEIKEAIENGEAQISGNFTPEEGRDLVRNLNYGALPLPIELLNTEKVGPTLGQATLAAGIRAGLIGLAFVALFMALWYRLPGLIAICALISYIMFVLLLFKLIPVTITSAGIAGFILSLGMGVDANVLIFSRIKEELAKGSSTREAVNEGFSRAWFSIRDSNISSIITAVILFWFGTSLVKGFALTLAIGVIVSMVTAVSFTRTLLQAITREKDTKLTRFLFSSGVSK